MMTKKRKLRKNFILFLFLFFLVICGKTGKGQVLAADSSILLIEGMKEEDVINIYPITMLEQETNRDIWIPQVKEWIAEKGNAYKNLTPERLQSMPQERAKEFVSLLLTGIQNEFEQMEIRTETGKENYEILLEPGYYVILPIGYTRIYDIKWFYISQGETLDLFYRGADQLSDMTEEMIQYDYQVSKISMKATNLTAEKTEEENEVGSFQEMEEQLKNSIQAVDQDMIRIESKIELPRFSTLYATEKRILNLYVTIPKGVEYVEDEEMQLLQEGEVIDPELYSKQQIEDVTIFEYQGEQLFFKKEGWYYCFDGSTLLAEGTDQEALELYLQNKRISESEEKNLDGENAADSESAENIEEEDTEDENIIGLEQLDISEHWMVSIYSLETECDWTEIDISYTLTKNNQTNETGRFPCVTGVQFSISPLNTSLRGFQKETVEIDSYGMLIYVILGTAYTKYESVEELLQKEERLKSAEFTLYQLNRVLNERPDTEESEEALEDKYYIESGLITKEYIKTRVIESDENGEINIGGLEKTEYLIMQTKYPEGFTYAQEMYVVSEASWEDETFIEGNYTAPIVWLDYPTVYLPATGKNGIGEFIKIGVSVGLSALFGMAMLLTRQIYEIHQIKKENDDYYRLQQLLTSVDSRKGEIL